MKGELKLNLVEDASVDPSSVGVFNHRDSREFVQVRDGSGYFEVANGNPAVAESSYVPSNQTVKVRPVEDGDVVLTVRDLCLTAQKSPSEWLNCVSIEHRYLTNFTILSNSGARFWSGEGGASDERQGAEGQVGPGKG